MRVDRREFLAVLPCTVWVALSGCAAVVITRVAPVDGVVRLLLRNYPQLGRPGGYLKIQPDGFSTPVYILANDDGRYVALSPICTHLGCTVNIEGARLVCPCHGSTYDRTGRVLRGPAERALHQLPASVGPDGELLIRLEDRA